MMSHDDAELLLDENFIAMDESNPFDVEEEENNPYYAAPKYKKKNDFNFTSLWRKPKMGRRKTRSIGKKQDASDESSFDDISSSLMTRGKYVKDRESFGTVGSVHLSDFDEAKDTLPFLHFRPANSNTRTFLKERTVLNPKMVLTQAPAKRRETINQIKKDKSVVEKMDEEESRDIFKPMHNNNNTFDAFQILHKESPNKVKVEDETQKKQKEEEADDLCDKENFFQDPVYCGGLYQDHGPILSSLSEDTIHSDSVRGEQFLEDHFNENEVDPRHRWKASSKDIEEQEEGKWGFRCESNQNEVQRVKSIALMDASATIETSVRSFSDRLKLFQSKSTEPAQQFKFESSKPKSSIPIGNLRDPKVMKHEEEANKDPESTTVPDTSEIKNLASDVKKCENSVECDIDKPDEQVVDEEHQVSTSELKTNATTHSHNFKRNMISSRVERNYFKQQQTTTGTKSSYQPDSCKDTRGKKSFTLNSVRDNSKKVQSKVVDLSLIGTNENQVVVKDADRDGSASRTNNFVEPTSCSEKEKTDSMKEGKDSISNSLQNVSGLPGRSMSLYSTKYRSSSNSQESVSRFGCRQDSKSNRFENELVTEIDEVAKTESSVGVTHPLDIVGSNEVKDHTVPVTKQAPTESELNKHEIKIEKPRDSFRAATLRFGRKLDQSESRFSRKLVTNIQGGDTKQSKEEEENEKEKTKHTKLQNSDNVEDMTVASKIDQVGSIDSKRKSGASGAKKSFEPFTCEVQVDGRTTPSLNGARTNTIKLSGTSWKDRGSNLRKPSLNPPSEKTSLGYSAPLLETSTTISNGLDSTPLESENKKDSKRAAFDDSTANSSISSLTRESILPTSFAQQSASIFGVTLLKRRENRIENGSEQKELIRLNEKSIAAGVCADKPDGQDSMDDSQTTRAKSDVVEKELQENGKNEKQNIVSEAYRRRKISSSSISTCSVDREMKNETSQLKQEEGPPIVEHSISKRRTGSSRQPVKFNENDRVHSLEDEMQLDAPEPKVEPISLSRKVKTLSISDRLKMFEQATVRNQIGFNRESDDIQDTARSDSPKSVETSGSPSSDDLSTSTKRRSTESGIKSVDDDLKSQLGQVETSPNKNYRADDDDVDDDDIVGDRRKTLKSNRGTRGTSWLSQPKSYEVPIHVLDKSEVDNVDDDVNRLENRSKTMKSTHEEKNIAEHSEKFLKKPSPPRIAYSARRKFFENLDRKRVQSSMSRPLVKQIEPMPIDMKSHREHVIELHNHDTLRDSDGLPMLVTFEEDFMLKDNISTCLSASENRSVICKPDALLYSVSQKAISLMSAKAENKSTISFSKTRRDEDKETIRNNNLDQKWLLAQRLKLNREESSNTVTTTSHSQLRSRFAKRKVTNSEEDPMDDAQDEDDKDMGLSIEKQQANKFRTSDISQRASRFERKKITSGVCRESKYDEEAVVSTDIQDKNYVKCHYSIEDKEPTEKRTAPFHQSKYNRFNNDSQGVGDESRSSMNSIEKTKNNKNCAISSTRQFECNHFVRKNLVLEKRNETESNDLREREENTVDHVRNPDDEVPCINENTKSATEHEEILDKQKIPTNNSSQQIGSMSIRARRKFFESQCGKVGSTGRNKFEKEESTVQNNSRKSSVSIAKSEDSEMTPLVGASVVEQCEPLAHKIDSDSTYRRSDLQKRVSSVSTGTLDYSLPSSSSNSRSDLSCKRASSASTNTHGPSSTPIYRRGFSSKVIRSSTAGQDKKKSDLCCF
jgi:hypothetical protein